MTFRTKFSEEACLFYISSLSKRGFAPVFFHKSKFSMKNFHLLHWGVGIFFFKESGVSLNLPLAKESEISLSKEKVSFPLSKERVSIPLSKEREISLSKERGGIRRRTHFVSLSLSPSLITREG